MTRDEVIALICEKAQEHGLVPWELLGGAIAESGLDPSAERDGVPPDVSFGLFQQTARYAPEGNLEGDLDRMRALYFDPAHATDVAAAQYKHWRYDPAVDALTAWCAYNLPASYHDPQSNPNIENYRAGLAEARRILGVAMPDPVYAADTPIVPQNHDWDCSEQSTLWSMTAFGRHPSDAWMEAQMIADGVVSPAEGLLDASGAGLAAWITAQYGPANNDPTLQYHAYNADPVSFNDVVQVAGLSPVMIGGRAWNHWTGVRRYDQSNDWLALANPANGWMGVAQTLTRTQFEALGPFSMVVVAWGTPTPAPAPTPPPPVWTVPDGVFAGMSGPELQQKAESLVVTLADVSDRLGDQLAGYSAAISSTVDQIRAEREQALGKRG